jgi:hypothetical protein
LRESLLSAARLRSRSAPDRLSSTDQWHLQALASIPRLQAGG